MVRTGSRFRRGPPPSAGAAAVWLCGGPIVLVAAAPPPRCQTRMAITGCHCFRSVLPVGTSSAKSPVFVMSSESLDPTIPAHRYQVIDVFHATHGGGNPLGVVLDARGWSENAMQRFASWTNLVETTFLLPPTKQGSADYRVRIFTPLKEIPFAGHPSVGSAHAFLSTRRIEGNDDTISSPDWGACVDSDLQLTQECGAGLLKIAVQRSGGGSCIYVQSPACHIIEQQPQEARRLLDTILVNQPLGPTPPAYLEGGRKWWLAEFSSEAAVRAFQPDCPAIEALAAASQSLGLCIFARSSPSSLVVRAFPLGAGIKEDPASGAANGLIASYLLMQVRLVPCSAHFRKLFISN
jgi:PhzF family phenazine biosynthesis protein